MSTLDASIRKLNECGCCEGLHAPLEISNRPGLAAIAYRIGTHARFKKAMLYGLSDSKSHSLKGLRTQDEDDFSIALLDAWAAVADVLTFYQERIANESYLRTAAEMFSVLQLARLIGYELSPGKAASTYLAFSMETAKGSPARTTIDIGTKVQSIPGPGEHPQIFETIEQIEAKVEWNELKPLQTRMRFLAIDDLFLYLNGITTNLKSGDALLIVGDERKNKSDSEQWEFRRITKLEIDDQHNRTKVCLDKPLGSRFPRVDPPAIAPKVYVLRLRAAIFGHNAQVWKTLPVNLRIGERDPHNPYSNVSFIDGKYKNDENSWAEASFTTNNRSINLDNVYSQIVLDSWIVLANTSNVELYGVTKVSEETVTEFNMTAKTTCLGISGENIEEFSRRSTTVYAQSEELELAESPVITVPSAPSEKLRLSERTMAPVEGSVITLDGLVPDLQREQVLIISGKKLHAKIADDVKEAELTLGSASLRPGEVLQLIKPPREKDGTVAWHLKRHDGTEGVIIDKKKQISLESADKNDEIVSEVVVVKEISGDPTTIKLKEQMKNCYDRATVAINANVAFATKGETVEEIMGNGDAGQQYQTFMLRQPPLTYVRAPTSSGIESTLKIRVNDLLWLEVPTLYERGPFERIFIARNGDDGKTTIKFGDGWAGARLPSGQQNVRAVYRKGIGLSGLVKAGQLSLLMSRPPGLKEVTNPIDASDAADPEKMNEAKRNAPLKVLTLDRIVSLRDYEDFAMAYTGIDKAIATWTWDGEKRGIFITIAGPGGVTSPDDNLINSLMDSMKKSGDPLVSLRIKQFIPRKFRIIASIKANPDYIPEKVQEAVKKNLIEKFSFEMRFFGQSVTLSEVIAVIQEVKGVISVDVDELYRTDGKGGNGLEKPLPAFIPPEAESAELLTLDSDLTNLKVTI